MNDDDSTSQWTMPLVFGMLGEHRHAAAVPDHRRRHSLGQGSRRKLPTA